MTNRQLGKPIFIVAIAALAVSAGLAFYSTRLVATEVYAPPMVSAGDSSDKMPSELKYFYESDLGIGFRYPSDMFFGDPEVSVHEPQETCMSTLCEVRPMTIGSIDLLGPEDALSIVVYSDFDSLDSFIRAESNLTVEDFDGPKYLDEASYVGPIIGSKSIDAADSSQYYIFANGHLYLVMHTMFDDEWGDQEDDWFFESVVFSMPARQ